MVTLLPRRVAAILIAAAPAIVTPVQAQGPDTVVGPRPTVGIVVEPFAIVTGPTVIALTPDTAARDLVAVRSVAESLGFTLVVRMPPLRQIIDHMYAAMYYLPRDLRSGYVLVVPGRRPDVVRGLVAPDSLRARLQAYGGLERHLSPVLYK